MGSITIKKQTIYSLRSWLIHIYTAIGGILGMFALFATLQKNFPLAFFLLILTMVIDSTDGMLARKYEVKKHLPQFDGSTLDNIIDTLNFAWIPIAILFQLGTLPVIVLVVPIVASMYAYGQSNMKTQDGFFLGFPTYWSIVALYIWLVPLNSVAATLLILVCGILSFVPTRYLYPSKNAYLRVITWPLTIVWFIIITVILTTNNRSAILVGLSLVYPIYYMLASFYVEYKYRTKHKK